MGMPSIEAEYRSRTPRSAELHERFNTRLPGGNTRSITHHLPYPLVLERGKGPLLWDVDGNSYIDLLYNYTSLVHGHAYPPIVNAIEANVGRGSVWPAGSRDQIELAELICGRIPSIERVRFCNSGTEAGMLAAKVARAVTGRPLILKADIGYHGSYDDLENPQTPLDKQRTVTAEFGNAESFERLLRESGDKVAAVFLEAVVGAGGIIAGSSDFLHRVQAAAKKVGAVFVLDEVITLRLAGWIEGPDRVS